MKRIGTLLLAALVAAVLLGGCGGNGGNTSPAAGEASQGEEQTPAEEEGSSPGQTQDSGVTITVGATPTPHAEILEVAKPVYEAMGYTLNIMEFTDYIQPNNAVADGEIDANYFQHQPYLDNFNAEHGTNLVSMIGIHYEPLGIYPGKTSALEELADGAEVAIPNDPTNEARALLLLEENGLIRLKPDAGLNATVKDITENPKNLKFHEIEAAQLTLSLADVNIAVINGNYAIQAGLNAATDALAKEEPDSLSGRSYINVLAVRQGDENREELKALVEALSSDEVKAFIEEKYQGSVVSVLD